jgi:putative MFS transporter
MDTSIGGVAQLHTFDDDVRMTPVRRRALMTIALGEFVDGFDLIVISGALLQLKVQFHLTPSQTGLLSAAAFLGSAVGALFFGDLTDRIGRRRVFVVNLVAFVALALLSAAITNVGMLLALRALMGVAIGADIAASMAFLAELSPRGSRGGWTGAMPQITWSLGALTAILLDAGLYVVAGSQAWRLMLAAGAVPAVVVLLLRRSLPDSPRWLLARGRVDDALTAFAQFGVTVHDPSQVVQALQRPPQQVQQGSTLRRAIQPYLAIFGKPFRGVAAFAILMIGLTPFASIGQSVLGPYVFQQFGHLTAIESLLSSALLWVGALLGSCLAWALIDRVGRILSIVISLALTIVVYVLMVTVARGNVGLVPLFFALGVLVWFGSSAWWPLPSELLPTAVRGRAQGLGSGLQRFSIAVNVYLVPVLLAGVGFTWTVLTSAAVALVLIPYALWGRRYEPAAKSLDEASGDALFLPSQQHVRRQAEAADSPVASPTQPAGT